MRLFAEQARRGIFATRVDETFLRWTRVSEIFVRWARVDEIFLHWICVNKNARNNRPCNYNDAPGTRRLSRPITIKVLITVEAMRPFVAVACLP